MAEKTELVVTLNQTEYLFVLDVATGKAIAYVGPIKKALSDQYPVIWNPETRTFDRADIDTAKRCFVHATEGQYVVLHNPATDPTLKMSPGRDNEPTSLQMGTMVILRGPRQFPLWPFQSAEVIDGHQLDADQFLRVRVIGKIADVDSRWLWPLVREDWRNVAMPEVKKPEGSSEGAESEGDKTPPAVVLPVGASAGEVDPKLALAVGTEHIVLGSRTAFFIPPTGVIVLPVLEDAKPPMAAAPQLPATVPARPVDQLLPRALIDLDAARNWITQRGESVITTSMSRRGLRPTDEFDAAIAFDVLDRSDGITENPQFRDILEEMRPDLRSIRSMREFIVRFCSIADKRRAAIQKEIEEAPAPMTTALVATRRDAISEGEKANKAKYVRSGVEVTARQYVELVNRTGRVSIVCGPTTVIPCVDQKFRLNPNTGTPVFEAIGIDENSGVLLQTVVAMTVNQAKHRVPGLYFAGGVQDSDELAPGAQLIVWKRECMVFPADGIEIVGRFDATHVPAGKAVYLKDRRNGKTRPVMGEVMLLPDPRYQEIVRRELTKDDIDLWFPRGGYDPAYVPRITVAQGTACCILGIDDDGDVSRNVVVGHNVHFLKWDEDVATVRVSTSSGGGKRKDWSTQKRICFLWQVGNRINDEVTGLRSQDGCPFTMSITLVVDFQKDQQDAWFDIDDYVLLACETVRSRLTGLMLGLPIARIWNDFVNITRDGILGVKRTEGEHRPGLLLERCGAKITDVDVHEMKILDTDLANQLASLQSSAVEEAISTQTEKTELEGLQARLTIAKGKHEVVLEGVKLATDEASAKKEMANQAVMEQAESDDNLRKGRVMLTHEASLQADKLANEAALESARLAAEKKQKQLELDEQLARERHKATVAEEARATELTKAKEENRKLIHELHATVETARQNLEKELAAIVAQTAKLQAEAEAARLNVQIDAAKRRMEVFVSQVKASAEAGATINNSILPQVAADLRLLAKSQVGHDVIAALGQAAMMKNVSVMELLSTVASGVPAVDDLVEAVKAIAQRMGSVADAVPVETDA